MNLVASGLDNSSMSVPRKRGAATTRHPRPGYGLILMVEAMGQWDDGISTNEISGLVVFYGWFLN